MKHLPLLALLVCTFACEGEKKSEVKPTPADPGAKSKTPAPVEPEAKKPPPPPKSKTTEFVSKDHKFSVMSERPPRTAPVKTPTGAVTTKYTFNAVGAKGAVMILVAAIPGGDKASRKKALEDAAANLVKKYNGKTSSDKEIKLGEHAGREVAFTATHPQMGKMAGRSKMIMRDADLYQVMWIGSPDASSLIAEGNALLDSFKFTD